MDLKPWCNPNLRHETMLNYIEEEPLAFLAQKWVHFFLFAAAIVGPTMRA